MPFVLLIIGAVLIVAAFNNAQGRLAAELQTDIPGFFAWAIAIAAILGLGYLPGLKTASRWLLALVLMVIVLKNYTTILSGFSSFAASGAKATGSGASSSTSSTSSTSTSSSPFSGQGKGLQGLVSDATDALSLFGA